MALNWKRLSIEFLIKKLYPEGKITEKIFMRLAYTNF
jgi:hypothetical protein